MPLSFDVTFLVVVVALLEVSLGVSLPAGHCANREHSSTLALFEIEDQLDVSSLLLFRARAIWDS